MEVEQKQADLVHQFVLLARDARGRAAAELITHATSNPQLFAFSELLSCNHIAEVVPCLFRLSLSWTNPAYLTFFVPAYCCPSSADLYHHLLYLGPQARPLCRYSDFVMLWSFRVSASRMLWLLRSDGEALTSYSLLWQFWWFCYQAFFSTSDLEVLQDFQRLWWYVVQGMKIHIWAEMSINAAAIGVSGWTSETLTVVFVQLKGTEHSGALDLLRLFAHGIWSDYKSKEGSSLPFFLHGVGFDYKIGLTRMCNMCLT